MSSCANANLKNTSIPMFKRFRLEMEEKRREEFHLNYGQSTSRNTIGLPFNNLAKGCWSHTQRVGMIGMGTIGQSSFILRKEIKRKV